MSLFVYLKLIKNNNLDRDNQHDDETSDEEDIDTENGEFKISFMIFGEIIIN